MAGLTKPLDTVIVAVPETAGSALYGMLDVLLAAGNIWQTLVRDERTRQLFRVRILAPDCEPFDCGNGIPVRPDLGLADDPAPAIVILPELWLGPDEPLRGRYPQLMDWIRRRHAAGASIYSACSGALMLAETGLLDTWLFRNLDEVRELSWAWMLEYNEERDHDGLGGLTPVEALQQANVSTFEWST